MWVQETVIVVVLMALGILFMIQLLNLLVMAARQRIFIPQLRIIYIVVFSL